MSVTGEVPAIFRQTSESCEPSSALGMKADELVATFNRLSTYAKAQTAELRLSAKSSTGSPISEMSLEDSERR